MTAVHLPDDSRRPIADVLRCNRACRALSTPSCLMMNSFRSMGIRRTGEAFGSIFV